MGQGRGKYRGLISADWNECLAPCGPFDPILFVHPHLGPRLTKVFRSYTSNRISLQEAVCTIRQILPSPVTREQMDGYLDTSFSTYEGVPSLIEWCLQRELLFMINTTGTQGYFQRILQKALLPADILVAANPLIHFAEADETSRPMYEVKEIQDKAKNTTEVMKAYDIPASRVIVMGDSGGDGPHFEWGRSVGAFLIGSMTKPSLEAYCMKRGIDMDVHFGLRYEEGEPRDPAREMQVDFMALADVIDRALRNTLTPTGRRSSYRGR